MKQRWSLMFVLVLVVLAIVPLTHAQDNDGQDLPYQVFWAVTDQIDTQEVHLGKQDVQQCVAVVVDVDTISPELELDAFIQTDVNTRWVSNIVPLLPQNAAGKYLVLMQVSTFQHKNKDSGNFEAAVYDPKLGDIDFGIYAWDGSHKSNLIVDSVTFSPCATAIAIPAA